MLMLRWISLNPNLGGWMGGGHFTPCWFYLNNSETVKRRSCQIWYSSLIPVSRYWAKLRLIFFRFPDFWDNSRTSDAIDMKLESVTTLDNKKETKSKKFDDDFLSEIMTSLSFFQFTANSEQSGSRIPDAYPVKRIFLLLVTFYLSKVENRIEKSLTQLLHYCFE